MLGIKVKEKCCVLCDIYQEIYSTIVYDRASNLVAELDLQY